MVRKIEIVVGFKCNNNCKFCSIGERDFNKTTKQIKKDIDRAILEKPKEINFTGGEPTIRKDILELIEYTKGKVDDIRVTTNGRMFSYKKFTEKAVSYGLTGAIFSIHGHKPELHDYLTSVKGSFNQAISGLKNLSDLVDNISINVVITSKNYKALPEITKFLIDRFSIRSFCFIYPTIDGNLKKNMFLLASYEDTVSYVEKAMEIASKRNVVSWPLNIPPCFLKKQIYQMELSTKMYWPDLDTDLDEKIKENKVKLDECKKCKLFNTCSGIPEDYLKVKKIVKLNPIKS